MEYIYFKSEKGNFGDDLNPWLWGRLFGSLLDANDAYFLGIGSILHTGNRQLKDLSATRNKIVFGTGVRPANDYTRFKMDKSWDIRFLRGPLSSAALRGGYPFITDAAYAIRLLPEFREKYVKMPKKYAISLMPYFHSESYFNWPKICEELGYHYISPSSEKGVDHTLQEIAASKMLITEAMHGAILADAFRIPWARFVLSTPHTEGSLVSEFKWNDWMHSVDIERPELIFLPFYQKNRVSTFFRILTNQMFSVEMFSKRKTMDSLFEKLAPPLRTFRSTDKKMQEIDDRIFREIERLKIML